MFRMVKKPPTYLITLYILVHDPKYSALVRVLKLPCPPVVKLGCRGYCYPPRAGRPTFDVHVYLANLRPVIHDPKYRAPVRVLKLPGPPEVQLGYRGCRVPPGERPPALAWPPLSSTCTPATPWQVMDAMRKMARSAMTMGIGYLGESICKHVYLSLGKAYCNVYLDF